MTKKRGFYQSKVISSLARIHIPGNWTRYYKLARRIWYASGWLIGSLIKYKVAQDTLDFSIFSVLACSLTPDSKSDTTGTPPQIVLQVNTNQWRILKGRGDPLVTGKKKTKKKKSQKEEKPAGKVKQNHSSPQLGLLVQAFSPDNTWDLTDSSCFCLWAPCTVLSSKLPFFLLFCFAVVNDCTPNPIHAVDRLLTNL